MESMSTYMQYVLSLVCVEVIACREGKGGDKRGAGVSADVCGLAEYPMSVTLNVGSGVETVRRNGEEFYADLSSRPVIFSRP